MVAVKETQEEDIPRLRELAEQEEHLLMSPTHTIWKDGEIVGCLSLGAVAFSNAFLKKSLTIRDTLSCQTQAERILRSFGYDYSLLTMGESSPVYPYMNRMGLTEIGATNLFLWKL